MWKARMEMTMIIANTNNCLCQRSIISTYKICDHLIIVIIIHFSLIRIQQKMLKNITLTHVAWLIYLYLVVFLFVFVSHSHSMQHTFVSIFMAANVSRAGDLFHFILFVMKPYVTYPIYTATALGTM